MSETEKVLMTRIDELEKDGEARERKIESLFIETNKIKIDLEGIRKDTMYIKQKLDNGLTKQITEIAERMGEFCPLVKDNNRFIVAFRTGMVSLAITGIFGGFIYAIMKAINNA